MCYIEGTDLFTCVPAQVLDFLLHSEAILDVQEILMSQCTALNPQQGSRKGKNFFNLGYINDFTVFQFTCPFLVFSKHTLF